jgi:cytochrome c biogenesis protein CcdA/thiol-disulfide isomerase/thioredoxin
MLLFFISLFAGFLTVLAPCTISLLPVIVGGSLAGGSSFRRALVVTASLGVSVVLFTLLLKASTAFINVPQSFWEIFSGVIITFLGFTILFPDLWDRIPIIGKLNRSSNKVLGQGFLQHTTLGDVLVGMSLGPVFSSCSPTYFLIIATVLPRSILGGLVYLLAYTFGLCATLLVVSVAGQKVLARFSAASDPRSIFKRVIGVLFIILGITIAFGLEAQIELAFANSAFNISGLEQTLLNKVGPLIQNKNATTTDDSMYPQAPEIANPSGFINTGGKPITIAGLKGQVILIDFWDYSCINCQREIPYVEAWYKKYAPEGLEVIGIHTPEFAFEKLQPNLQAAVTSLGITYPVVMDNEYSTWNAFNNEYWPQVYLIDNKGFIVYSHSGEGDYDKTEAAIQNALKQRAIEEGTSSPVSGGTVAPAGAVEVNSFELGSPETYFGYDSNQYLGNGRAGEAGNQSLVIPSSIHSNSLYLGGSWNFFGEYAETSDTQAGKIVYQFTAKDVYMVATGNPKAVVKILLDGKPVGSNAGADVSSDGTMTVNADKLYKLISLPQYGTHTLEIDLQSGTLDGYTFTFG